MFSSKFRAGAFPGSLIVQMWSGFLNYSQYREDMKVFAWKPMKRREILSKSDLVFKKGLAGISLEKFTGLKRQAQLSSCMSHDGSALNLSLVAHAFTRHSHSELVLYPW